MLNDNFAIVKDVIDKYQINKYWNLSPKYYNAYINKICGDYLYENDIAFKNSKFIGIKSFYPHVKNLELHGDYTPIIFHHLQEMKELNVNDYYNEKKLRMNFI